MKRFSFLSCIALGLTTFVLFSGFKRSAYRSGDSIMTEFKQRHGADTEIQIIKMSIIDDSGNTQTREFINVMKPDTDGNLRYLIRFTRPQEIDGVSLLTIDKGDDLSEQYLYLPAIGLPRKISGKQKSSFFMGSDFTYEDLRLENPQEHVYHRLMDDEIEGHPVYAIMSAPKDLFTQTATGFANRIIYLDKETLDILKIEFYEANETEPSKTFRAYDYESSDIEGKTHRPHRAVMNNHKKKTTSIMTVLKARMNVPIDEAIFDPDSLAKWTPESNTKLLKVFSSEGQ